MLFDCNVKLLIVLVLLVVLVQMLNKPDPLPNDGTLEFLDQDQADSTDIPETGDDVLGDVLDTAASDMPEKINEFEVDDDKIMDDVLAGSKVKGNDLDQPGVATVDGDLSSVTAKNMEKLIEENEKNQLQFKSSELLPNEVNKDWFETDFSHAQVNVNNDNLVVTDKYVIGVNTVGQSLKNPSYDLRSAPPCPKFTVSPWNQSTIEPDFNIKSVME